MPIIGTFFANDLQLLDLYLQRGVKIGSKLAILVQITALLLNYQKVMPQISELAQLPVMTQPQGFAYVDIHKKDKLQNLINFIFITLFTCIL